MSKNNLGLDHPPQKQKTKKKHKIGKMTSNNYLRNLESDWTHKTKRRPDDEDTACDFDRKTRLCKPEATIPHSLALI